RKRQAVLSWISGLNFCKRQSDYLARSHAGTGEWFLRHKTFQSWSSGDPRTFWCYGSLTINSLLRRFGNHASVAYIYFNYKEQETQTVENMMANLLE
ncbi:hypothetical protein B0H67DRAFT_480825, partial [Lasiosphaeris hirsuta]